MHEFIFTVSYFFGMILIFASTAFILLFVDFLFFLWRGKTLSEKLENFLFGRLK